MQYFFIVATFIMNRLGYAWKFLAIGLIFLVPFGYLVYLQYQAATASVVFSLYETYGVDYCVPTETLLRAINLYRLDSSAVKLGYTDARDEANSQREQITASIAPVQDVESKFGSTFIANYGDAYIGTQEVKDIDTRWKSYQSKQFDSLALDESSGNLNDIAAKIDDLILNQVSNGSNLILDPDTDSYWLMDSYVGKLPAIADLIGTSGVKAMKAAQAGSISMKDRIDLAGDIAKLTQTVSDYNTVDLAAIYPFDKNKGGKVKTAIDSSVQKLNADTKAYADLITNGILTVDKANITLKVSDILAAAKLATLSTHKLHVDTAPELRSLCQTRVDDKYGTQRRNGLIAAGAAIVVIIYVFIGFFYSVRNSVRYLADATKKMITGTSQIFVRPSLDEVGDIAVSFNQINAALVEARDLRTKEEAQRMELQNQISELLMVVSDASDGNLTVRAKVTEGAMGNVADALNLMLGSIGSLIAQAREVSTRVASAAAEIQTAAEQLSGGAEDQVAQISDVTTAAQEMSANTDSVAANARAASEAAKRALEAAAEGAKRVEEVVSGMQRIRANVQAGAKKVKRLGERSMEINQIVETINLISAQTDMLALNAAIEAARAGEHGRGFSVVAEEVRKLAESSAKATKEISALIESIQAETNETVTVIDHQTSEVEGQVSTVQQAGGALTNIRAVSQQSNELVSEITMATAQQARGTKGVVEAMERIGEITKQTRVGAEQTQATTLSLTKLAEELKTQLSKFNVSAT